METSLRFDSVTRKLALYGKENFVTDDNIVLTVAGFLQTDDGTAHCRASLRKKFFPDTLTRIDVGAKYDSMAEEVLYGVAARKSVELSEDGLLSLDLKGACDFSLGKRRAKFRGCVELSQKIFNFTEDQDLKLKLGVDVFGRGFYAQIRENNWTLTTNFRGRWNVAYDL